MITALKSRAEDRTGHRISAAVTATPHLLALYAEDILDAFEYCGLQHLHLSVRGSLANETGPAYAGYGLGLCSDYTSFTACDAEQMNMPWEAVSTILFTRTALTVTLTTMKGAYYTWEPRYRRLEDFTLGYDARHDNPREEYYWERVRERLIEIMVRNQYYQRPAKVLLLGESVLDETFARVLREALSSVMEEVPEILEDEAMFIAAKGAAEFAKRARYDPRNSHVEGIGIASRDIEMNELCQRWDHSDLVAEL